jgi:hypothetical protein
MKEKDFNQSLKTAVEYFETYNQVSFNKERVWRNIKIKKRIIWFDILKVVAVIILFLSVGVWINSSEPVQKVNQQENENEITPKLNPLENIATEKAVIQTQPIKDIYVKNNSSLRNEVEIIKSKSTILESDTFEIEPPRKLAMEAKPLIKESVKAIPEIVYAVEFKRGMPQDKSENKQKEDALVISFKKYKKPLFKPDTNTVMANSNTSNNIFKLKF